MLHVKIKACPNKRMAGAELRRARQAAGLSQEGLVAKMYNWGWTRDKITGKDGIEAQLDFELVPAEMQALLDALGATSL